MRKFERISFKQFKKDVCDSRELYDKIELPSRSTKNSAGYDIRSIENVIIKPGESKAIKTGVKVSMNSDEVLYIFDRSSLGFKYDICLSNSVGVIDSDYRGEIKVPLYNDSNVNQSLDNKERVAQIVIMPYLNVTFNEVDTLSESNRDQGGFGSTGTK